MWNRWTEKKIFSENKPEIIDPSGTSIKEIKIQEVKNWVIPNKIEKIFKLTISFNIPPSSKLDGSAKLNNDVKRK